MGGKAAKRADGALPAGKGVRKVIDEGRFNMPYAILRMEKHKGGSSTALEKHHERKKEAYASNPDIDVERTIDNYHIKQPKGKYYYEIQRRIEASHCRIRKDSVKMVDTIIAVTPEFIRELPAEEQRALFQHAYDFMAERVGENNIFSAVIHMDEATPHMHLCYVPLTKDNRLSAKDILGNKVAMRKWQDEFHTHMSARWPMLERGEPARETGREHMDTKEFKMSQFKELEVTKRRLHKLQRMWERVPYPVMKKIYDQEQAKQRNARQKNFER